MFGMASGLVAMGLKELLHVEKVGKGYIKPFAL